MKYCPNCGAMAGDQKQYCGNCGTSVIGREEFSIEEQKIKFCASCGNPVDKQYCGNCGTSTGKIIPVQKKNFSIKLPKKNTEEGTKGFFGKYFKFKGKPHLLLAVIAVLVLISAVWGGIKWNIHSKSVESSTWHPYVEDGLFGFKNKDGKVVIPAQFTAVDNFARNGLAPVATEKHIWGFINYKGEIVVDAIYEDAGIFGENGLAPVSLNGETGYINAEGEYVIPSQYDLAFPFTSNGLARVYDATKEAFGYINKKGEWVIPATYYEALDFAENGIAWVGERIENDDESRVIPIGRYIDSDGKKWKIIHKYIDSSGKECIKNDNFVDSETGQKDGVFTIIRRNSGPFTSVGYAPVKDKKSDLYGFIDGKGNYVIKPQYEDVSWFAENGLAAVKDSFSKKWGFIDVNGKYVIDPQYEDASGFYQLNFNEKIRSENFAYIDKGDSVKGVINRNGDYIIAPTKDYSGIVYKQNGIIVGIKITYTKQYIGDKDYNDSGDDYDDEDYDDDDYDDDDSDDYEEKREVTSTFINAETKDIIATVEGVEVKSISRNGLALVYDEEKECYGFMNGKGKYVIEPIYKYAEGFNSMGLAYVQSSDGDGYYINAKEKRVNVNKEAMQQIEDYGWMRT